MLRPSRHTVDHGSLERETLEINEAPLECFVRRNYTEACPADLLVLKFPGTAGRAERSTDFPAKRFANVRTSQWTWNPPGYGASQGKASLNRIAATSLEFWRQVIERESNDSTTIWLCGNSLGCVTAMNVAAAMQPDPRRCGMILRNPPPLISVVKRAAARYPAGSLMGPVAESLVDSMNLLITSSQSKLPAVFLQSELDNLVPVDHQNDAISRYAGENRKVLMKGLGHGGIATDCHEPLIEEALQWLWDQTRNELNNNRRQDERILTVEDQS
ncbi:MAG: alpha/beta hydrolase [Rubripirellula sp.]